MFNQGLSSWCCVTFIYISRALPGLLMIVLLANHENMDNRKDESLTRGWCHPKSFFHQLASTDLQSCVRSNDGV